jgi:hypothetical protein
MALTESGGRAVMKEGGPPRRRFAVFLRAANVGGHQVFSPSKLARTLAPMGCRSIGAAGTFAFGSAASAREVEAAVRLALPFAPDLIVVPARAVADLVASRPFGNDPAPAGESWFATALVSKPPRGARLPIDLPAGGPWQIRVVARSGPFVLSRRRAGSGASSTPTRSSKGRLPPAPRRVHGARSWRSGARSRAHKC